MKIIIRLKNKTRALCACHFCNTQQEGNYVWHKLNPNAPCKKCSNKIRKNKNQKHPIVNKYHRLFRIFNSMHQRTTNSKHNKYEYYGGRGILICNEWLKDRTKFYDWALTNGYSSELTIDRNDNDKGYSPNNCSWKTKSEQQHNTSEIRKNNTSGYKGVSKTIKKEKIAYRTRITFKGKEKHIGIYNTALEAASAYNKYCDENNLNHTRNKI